jgi:mannose-6-phosphate isomerase-like protein (cupin superfamily)
MLVDIRNAPGFTTPEPFVREVRVLLSPLLQPELSETGVVVGYTEVGVGQRGSRHNHPGHAEVWMFFAGQGVSIVGGVTYEVGPGSVVYTPPGADHEFINTGDEPVKLYWLFAPPGPERAVLEATFR